VTSFYDPVTEDHAPLTHVAAGFDTTKLGEAMASAPGPVPPVGALVPAPRRFLARSARNRLGRPVDAAALLLAALAATACGGGARPSVGPPLPGPAPGEQADPSIDADHPAEVAYYEAVLAEEIAGDIPAAKQLYDRALTEQLAAALATRAALRWAVLEAATGGGRRAIELVARASALADGDPVLTASADRLQGAITSIGPAAIEVRGPPLGTPIAGDAATAARFAHAEELLARAHRLRPRGVIQVLSSSIRAKEIATETAVRAFRDVAELGPAAIAADYRIGSAYHDLALALVFELPPELDPGVAGQLRRTLRANALGYLRKAVTAYRRALERSVPGAELWIAAAQSDLRAALDLLGEP
jgi:tetratricopeptide (TPR) repeat protein